MKKKLLEVQEVRVGIFIDPEDSDNKGRTYAVIIPTEILKSKQCIGGPFAFLLGSRSQLVTSIVLAGDKIDEWCMKELEKNLKKVGNILNANN